MYHIGLMFVHNIQYTAKNRQREAKRQKEGGYGTGRVEEAEPSGTRWQRASLNSHRHRVLSVYRTMYVIEIAWVLH